MFDLRRHPEKRYWIFLSQEFVDKHPHVSAQFWVAAVCIALIVGSYFIYHPIVKNDAEYDQMWNNYHHSR